MPLALARIDDRLIHGQVVEGWAPLVQATHLLVASDSAAADPAQQALFSLAVPDDLTVRCCSLQAAARSSRTQEWDGERVLLLLASPQEALAWMEAGAACPSINIGGLHYAQGKTQISAALSLSPEDLAAFGQLKQLGVQLEVRALPFDPPNDLWTIIAQTAPHLLRRP